MPTGRRSRNRRTGYAFGSSQIMGQAKNIYQAFGSKTAPAAILVGPEGGFSPTELELLAAQDFTLGVSLGPRILRAETAAAAALSCWQAICGDWKNEE